MAAAHNTGLSPSPLATPMQRGRDPFLSAAACVFLGQALLWLSLLFRWATFNIINWQPLAVELALAQWSPVVAYAVYGALAALAIAAGIGLLRETRRARPLALATLLLTLVAAAAYYSLAREFYGAVLLAGLSGLTFLLLTRRTAWSLAYPSFYWLLIFFLIPLAIVFVVSLGERTRLGTVTYDFGSARTLFDDYARIFSRINGEFIYLRIFGRSLWLAFLNTAICLLFAYPFAYWIARQPANRRTVLIFLVMIPFWTNFLVRTYAWMLILRDSGLINNFWSITLHEQAVRLAGVSPLFDWLAAATSQKLPLLYNFPAVLLGLFYGYLPFMVLPLYTNLEKVNWSLLEAASDLYAGRRQSFRRILLPLTLPGIIAGSIIVFIPSLGAYVTPDLMGGAKVSLLGNLLQQQFMTVRDWPFGSAISFIMMAVMLAATLVYFRVSAESERAAEMTVGVDK
ncbi:MAG: ABC transporter permease [Anaerolineales bacterium]|uniref:ABC transporter permease n=1 Tax=Promineifilum sp. TaxID=2664178 RepID=UPI001D2EBDDD|nr:ABC transporter permease [Anaerolineales bacterium]MCO5182255.1 ABC transporter permease [Promineifilum sp.]